MENGLLDQLGNDVPGQNVTLLNTRSFVRRNTDAVIDRLLELPAAASCEAHSMQPLLPGSLHSPEYIRRITTGGKTDRDIARSSQCFNLTREYLIEPVVVSDCRHARGVHR